MILQIRCTKCTGQVIERDGLDGNEKICLNCGFAQIPNIVPDEALAKDSADHQVRNRSTGWSAQYVDLRSPYQLRKDRGQIVVKREYRRSTDTVNEKRRTLYNKQKKERKLASSFYGEH